MYHFMVVVECETQLVAIYDPFFDLAYTAHHFNQLAFRAVAHGANAVSPTYFFIPAALLLLKSNAMHFYWDQLIIWSVHNTFW